MTRAWRKELQPRRLTSNSPPISLVLLAPIPPVTTLFHTTKATPDGSDVLSGRQPAPDARKPRLLFAWQAVRAVIMGYFNEPRS